MLVIIFLWFFALFNLCFTIQPISAFIVDNMPIHHYFIILFNFIIVMSLQNSDFPVYKAYYFLVLAMYINHLPWMVDIMVGLGS